MKVPATSLPQNNPQYRWLNSRGTWLYWSISIAILHVLLLSMPFFSTPTVWTLTHAIHNTVVYVLFHHMKELPFSGDQGISRRLTVWEKLDNGEQFTAGKKFVIGLTILLFLISSMYTFGDKLHTIFNLGMLCLGIIPKSPLVHKFRLFGINKY